MGSKLPELPKLSPEKHRWEKSNVDPRVLQRRGIGSEAIVGMERSNRRGQYDLYLLATLRTAHVSTSTPLSLLYLKEKLELALLVMRFEHPECACTVTWDDQVPPIIQYASPQNDEEALMWAKSSVHIRTTSQTGFDVRYEIEGKRQDLDQDNMEPSRPIVIYLISNVTNGDAQLTSGATVDVLLHMNHLFWDGISARMFTGDLFRELNKLINSNEQELPKLQWGTEASNLSAPVLDALKINIEELREEFEAASNQFVKALYENYGGWGLEFKSGLGLPRTDIHTSTATESKAIINGVKTRLGPQYTISHLAQAAVVIAMLEIIQPPNLTDKDIFVSPMPVNGRRWLKDGLADHHYSICETGAVIRIENIKSLVLNNNNDKGYRPRCDEKKPGEDVKKSFDQWLGNPYQLALGLAVHTLEASFLTANPMPFDKVAAPFFISDGRNEQFIPASITTTTGEILMTIDNFVFFLNQCLPYLAIRLESWKDASTLSVCYNKANYSQEEATKFLKCVAKYMLIFSQ
uniref:Trichothecene O-acetyltransferase TRI3 n=1 Tax=Trichoderma arundinaceum TaxID=490622 RepID=TRI3_TRIAR|nr:RecName: Full=Trichothecene O-acetyltransferase TRI3; AltName: Full=Trichothecene biosynthesis cluster protein 3 [Trichoderma arundinaceum]CAY87361.1 putative trichothecene 15-O-acetyltransferase [Trichoderma arundinaceum]